MSTNLDVTDLRRVYQHTFDSFALIPSDLADALDNINTRYARQLLAELKRTGLVTESEGDEGTVWQTFPDTYDTITWDEAFRRFHEIYKESNMSKNATKARPAPKTKDEGYHDCKCGCGERVPSKSNYRPGHDARHAGQVARTIVANYTTKGFDRRTVLADLPSDALKAKAEDIAGKSIAKIEDRTQRAADRATAKAKREAEKAVVKAEEQEANLEHGIVKVGKKEFTATRNPETGEVLYFDGDATKRASKTAAKSFTA